MFFYEEQQSDWNCFPAPGLCYPPHFHRELELVWMKKGQMRMELEGRPALISKGDLAVIFPHCIHSYENVQGTQPHCEVLIASGARTGELAAPLEQGVARAFRVAARRMPADAAFALEHLFCDPFHPVRSKAYLQILLTAVWPLLEVEKRPEGLDGDAARRAVRYVTQNACGKAFTQEEMARELGISRFHLSRVFRSRLHVGFNTYVNGVRVGYARELLAGGDSVTDIAFACGFESTRTFNRAFRGACGMSPREYRRLLAAGDGL